MSDSESEDWKEVVKTTYEEVVNSGLTEKSLAKVLDVGGHFRVNSFLKH